ncbi:acyltransferase, partial [uncultured Alistipes sp.]
MSNISATAFADTKPHYNILDGLRGIAALTVVCFHLFEAFATSHLDQRINHGYLAVDFFFILSGFVVGYAYDDRWKKMTVAEFLKRRFIRLHPMVVMGAVIGAVMFYFQGCSVWDVSTVSMSMLLVATLLNALLIPAAPGSEIRGLGEMYPLNGPSWSLFFEYIGNILYAFFIRKLPTRA